MSFISDLFSGVAQEKLKALANHLLPEKLVRQLQKTVEEWVSTLPDEFRKDIETHSVLYGFDPNSVTVKPEATKCWEPIYQSLSACSIPSQELWFKVLHQRWKLAPQHYPSDGCQPIYQADDQILAPLLNDLSQRLEATCAQNPDLCNPDMYRKLGEIREQLNQLLNLQSHPFASVPGGCGDQFDSQIDKAKDNLDQHH